MTALFDVCIKILRKRDENIFKDFFKSFKSNFKQATLIWVPMAVVGVVLFVGLWFWDMRIEIDGDFSSRVFYALNVGFLLVWTAIIHYVFAVQAVFENTVKATVKTAFLMSLKHFPNTIILLACTAALIYGCMISPVVIAFLLFVGVGLFGMIYSVRLLVVFRKHNDALAPADDDGNNEPILQLIKNKKEKGERPDYGKSKVIK